MWVGERVKRWELRTGEEQEDGRSSDISIIRASSDRLSALWSVRRKSIVEMSLSLRS